MQQRHIDGQERYLDQILTIAQVLKHQNEDFGREVKEQTKMIEQLNNDIDHTKLGLAKVDSRLGELVGEMSFCKLWTVVVVEIILIVVIISM